MSPRASRGARLVVPMLAATVIGCTSAAEPPRPADTGVLSDPADEGMPPDPVVVGAPLPAVSDVEAVVALPGGLALVADDRLWTSTPDVHSWVEAAVTGRFTEAAVVGEDLVLGGHGSLSVLHGETGITTRLRPGSMPTLSIHGLTATGEGELLAYVAREGLFASADGGSEWRAVPGEGLPADVSDLAATAGTVVAATPAGIFVSRDGGGSFAAVDPAAARAVTMVGSGYVAATADGLVGASRPSARIELLQPAAALGGQPVALAADEDGALWIVVAGTNPRLLVSDDGGRSVRRPGPAPPS